MFLDNRVHIRTGILNTVQHQLANEASTMGLISKGVHRIVTDTRNHLTTDDRANLFMEEIETQIRLDSMALTKFVDLLRKSDAAYYGAVIRIISKSYTYILYKLLVPT